jgi:hypothetical protein
MNVHGVSPAVARILGSIRSRGISCGRKDT